MGEILIFADINGEVAQLASNGWSVAINGAWLQLSVLKHVQAEVSCGFRRWCPEVHLIIEAPLCKNGPLCLIDRSGWSSLRSLNLCCHCLREALLLDCCGLRSQAWRFRFDRYLCRVWLNGWVTILDLFASRNKWLWRTLGEGTILFEWFGLVWIACLLSHSSGLGCVKLWGLPISWYTRSGFSTEGHTEGPTSSPPSSLI